MHVLRLLALVPVHPLHGWGTESVSVTTFTDRVCSTGKRQTFTTKIITSCNDWALERRVVYRRWALNRRLRTMDGGRRWLTDPPRLCSK
eukprot:3837126-Prymnesium_polylepis.1